MHATFYPRDHFHPRLYSVFFYIQEEHSVNDARSDFFTFSPIYLGTVDDFGTLILVKRC